MNKFASVIRALKGLRYSSTKLQAAVTPDEELAWKAMVDEAVTEFFEPLTPAEQLEWHLMVLNHQLEEAHPCFDKCGCGRAIAVGSGVCDACLEESELLVPSVCLGCGKIDKKVVLDFCYNCEIDGTEFRIRGGHL